MDVYKSQDVEIYRQALESYPEGTLVFAVTRDSESGREAYALIKKKTLVPSSDQESVRIVGEAIVFSSKGIGISEAKTFEITESSEFTIGPANELRKLFVDAHKKVAEANKEAIEGKAKEELGKLEELLGKQ